MDFIYKSYFDEVKKKIAACKEKALEAVGIFIEGEAKSRCPVGDSGNLRGSYTHQVEARDDKVVIGSNVEYSVYVEKGTSKSRAQPHLTPAAEENLGKIEEIVRKHISYE